MNNLNAYIRKDDRKYITLFEKLNRLLNKFFSRVSIEKIENGIIILVPQNFTNNKKIMKSVNDILESNEIQNIVCEQNLEELLSIRNKTKVLCGKILMKKMIIEIYKYIYLIKGKNTELNDVYIFVNNYTEENINIIQEFAYISKNVNIITENLTKFKKLEKYFENQDIIITISNNKRKSARMAKNIINIDFTGEELCKYIINSNSIIINLQNEAVKFPKSFNGILINNFDVSVDIDEETFVNEFYGNINYKLFLESCIHNVNNELMEKIYIKEIYGIHGIIDKQEIRSNGENNIVKITN